LCCFLCHAAVDWRNWREGKIGKGRKERGEGREKRGEGRK